MRRSSQSGTSEVDRSDGIRAIVAVDGRRRRPTELTGLTGIAELTGLTVQTRANTVDGTQWDRAENLLNWASFVCLLGL